MIQLDRRHFIASLGGAAAVKLMSAEAKAEALESYMMQQLKTGMTEEVILACLLHDTVHALIKTDHGYWGAQLYGPYVPEKVSFAIRYHQALRFYDDKEAGYIYPDLYRNMFGEDYVPLPHIQA